MSNVISNPSSLSRFANESDLIQQLYGSLTDKEGFHPFLEQLSQTVNANASIILSDQSQVLHTNKQAQALLASQSQIRLIDDSLVLSDPLFQQEFIMQVQATLRGDLGLNNVNASTVFMPRHEQCNLIMCLSGIENIGPNRSGIMLTLYDPEYRKLPSAHVIASYFDLTKAEAELCCDLINGLSLKAIAEQKHRAEATLRSHLKQIFKKTGFQRQGQLISNILAALMY